MYKISRSVCNEQQLKHKMHVVDIRTVCICEEISYVPIWTMNLPLSIIMRDVGPCIYVHHSS